MIGVCINCDSRWRTRRGRRVLYIPSLATAKPLQRMGLLQGIGRKYKLCVQTLHDGIVDVERLLDERSDGVFHSCINGGGIFATNSLWPCKSIVFCNVDKFSSVRFSGAVNDIASRTLVPMERAKFNDTCIHILCNHLPERRASVTLFVFILLFQRQSHRFGSHIEHFVNFVINTMIFKTVSAMMLALLVKIIRPRDILPKSQGCCGSPEAVAL